MQLCPEHSCGREQVGCRLAATCCSWRGGYQEVVDDLRGSISESTIVRPGRPGLRSEVRQIDRATPSPGDRVASAQHGHRQPSHHRRTNSARRLCRRGIGLVAQARSDKERELRAEKRAAYVELIQRLNAFEHSLLPLRAAIQSRNEGARHVAIEEARQALAQVNGAVSVVRLIAPANRDAEVADLMAICIAAITNASGFPAAGPDRAAELYPALVRMLTLARSELGLTH